MRIFYRYILCSYFQANNSPSVQTRSVRPLAIAGGLVR